MEETSKEVNPVWFLLFAAVLCWLFFFVYNQIEDDHLPKQVWTGPTYDGLHCLQAIESPCGLNLFSCENGDSYRCRRDVRVRQ